MSGEKLIFSKEKSREPLCLQGFNLYLYWQLTNIKMTTKTTGTVAQGAATSTSKNAVSTATVNKSGTISDPKEETKKVIPLPQSVETRKNRNELFNKLLDKHEAVMETHRKMEGFIIGSDDNSTMLALKDAKGNTFNTGNPAVIKPVIEMVRKQIIQQVGVIEEEILDFIV
jgi:hypothetical protein